MARCTKRYRQGPALVALTVVMGLLGLASRAAAQTPCAELNTLKTAWDQAEAKVKKADADIAKLKAQKPGAKPPHAEAALLAVQNARQQFSVTEGRVRDFDANPQKAARLADLNSTLIPEADLPAQEAADRNAHPTEVKELSQLVLELSALQKQRQSLADPEGPEGKKLDAAIQAKRGEMTAKEAQIYSPHTQQMRANPAAAAAEKQRLEVEKNTLNVERAGLVAQRDRQKTKLDEVARSNAAVAQLTDAQITKELNDWAVINNAPGKTQQAITDLENQKRLDRAAADQAKQAYDNRKTQIDQQAEPLANAVRNEVQGVDLFHMDRLEQNLNQTRRELRDQAVRPFLNDPDVAPAYAAFRANQNDATRAAFTQAVRPKAHGPLAQLLRDKRTELTRALEAGRTNPKIAGLECSTPVVNLNRDITNAINRINQILASTTSGVAIDPYTAQADALLSGRDIDSLLAAGPAPTTPAPATPAPAPPGSKTFDVRPGGWLSTGIQLKKGQSFTVTATGTCKHPTEKTGWGPDGYYLIGFMNYNLKAKVGKDLFEVGSSGGGTAATDGPLLLGITRAYEPNPDDAKIQGSFKAVVTTTAIPSATPPPVAGTTPPPSGTTPPGGTRTPTPPGGTRTPTPTPPASPGTTTPPPPAGVQPSTEQPVSIWLACPVQLQVRDAQGRTAAMGPDGKIANAIPNANVVAQPDSAGGYNWYAGLPKGQYSLKMTGTAPGTFFLKTKQLGQPVASYPPVRVDRGTVATIAVSDQGSPQRLRTGQGELAATLGGAVPGATPSRAIDLTGSWKDQTGATYSIRQVGDTVSWQMDHRPWVVNSFQGTIQNGVVQGRWQDQPGGRAAQQSGNLRLRIESNDRLAKLDSSSYYQGEVWTRMSSAAPAIAGGSGGQQQPYYMGQPPQSTQPPGARQPAPGANRAPKAPAGDAVDPRVLAIMDEWLAKAIPPQQRGDALRYDSWGRLTGRSRNTTLPPAPPPQTTLSRGAYLWQQAGNLQSTNLGTLKQYVERRLNQGTR